VGRYINKIKKKLQKTWYETKVDWWWSETDKVVV
jgi:hypothetical protein